MTGPKLNEYPAARPGASAAGHGRAADGAGACPLRADLGLQGAGGARPHPRPRRRPGRRDPAVLRARRGHRRGQVLASAVANAEQQRRAAGRGALRLGLLRRRGPDAQALAAPARGRATRIRKRTCHITVIVSRLPDDELQKRRSSDTAASAARRRRIAGQKAAAERTRTRRAARRRGHARGGRGRRPR